MPDQSWGRRAAGIEVVRERTLRATSEAVYATLANPDNLAGLLPRVERIELIERGADRARIATHMAFGPLGRVRTEGEARWIEGREIVFSTRQFVAVDVRWLLAAAGPATHVSVTLHLDLSPLLGPLAGFVPPEQVTSLVAPDLEAALAAIARKVERQGDSML